MNITNKQLKCISYMLMILFITLMIPLHLFTCFISGFFVYKIILFLTPSFLEKSLGVNKARLIIITIISLLMIFIFSIGIINTINCLKFEIFQKNNFKFINSDIFIIIKNLIPDYFTDFLPESTEKIKYKIFSLINSNLNIFRKIFDSFVNGSIMIFLGLILGSSVALNKPFKHNSYFIKQLSKRIINLYDSFSNVVYAQIKVSFLNTILTTLIMLILFIFLKIKIPFIKELILITFIFGLFPIIGNIISNSMITISAFHISFIIGTIMLIYLIFIHKLEYFLNAEIVGKSINSKSWELLLAMIILKSIFGLEGLIAAPIYYAYLKKELKYNKII
ncbi:MAG: AI-2E family transporter [Candidatus Makana argininalis]